MCRCFQRLGLPLDHTGEVRVQPNLEDYTHRPRDTLRRPFRTLNTGTVLTSAPWTGETGVGDPKRRAAVRNDAVPDQGLAIRLPDPVVAVARACQ